MAADARRAGARSRLALLASAAAALLVAACDAPTGDREEPTFDPRPVAMDATGQFRPFVYHWPLGATISVFVDPTAAPAGSDLRSAFLDGAAMWTQALYYREATFALVSDPRDADVVVRYGEASRIVGSGSCAPPSGSAVGITFFCADLAAKEFETLPLLGATAGGSAAGHVKMDVAVYRARAADEATFRRLVAHEVGHVLGIGTHSPSAADLMYAFPSVDAPSAGDARTLRYVLHQPADLRP
jgi:hypothetical protein